MYAVLGEDRSDVDTLRELIARISLKAKRPSISAKGYDGCGEMLRKGARDLRAFAKKQCTRYIVCYDSDRDNPVARRERVLKDLIEPAGLLHPTCVLVPVQEIEAWILADLPAVQKVIPSWRGPHEEYPNPETINDPKEFLMKLSRHNGKPLYANAVHNPRIAQFLDIEKVERKCPSFRPLIALVRNGKGNL